MKVALFLGLVVGLLLVLAAVHTTVAYNHSHPCIFGRDCRDGLPGPAGPPGPPGLPGTPGKVEIRYLQTPATDTHPAPSPPPTNSSGVTYIRWGRTSCPTGNGTEYVYDGITAGSWYSYSGGGSNYICLVKNPKYPQEATTTSGNYIYGTEYETSGGPLNEVSQNNPPCAACHVTTRSAQLMVPGTDECPRGWTLEYAGWLVSAHQSHYRTMYVCLDKDAEVLEGEEANTDDALMYNTVVDCGGYGIPCPPYVNQKDLACAVCTK